ncbi:MAG: metalloregulator ArsR/SmtB family transcription factor [Nitrospiraceae bacterium]|nr:metalloregulator ArsR/SmtB family transcription factor [Nitrospiraceae bacterium]
MDSLSEKVEVLRVMAHPVRIRILKDLTMGVKCVSDFEDFLEISQPNVSQHLSVLRSLNIIDYYVDGRLRCYYLVNPLIPEIVGALEKELDPLPAPACCPVTKKGKYPGERRH